MRRLFLVFLGLALVFLIPFLIWGDAMAWDREGLARWFDQSGRWAWALALGLLMVALFLPIPATAIMATLGFYYGPLLGGLIGTVGFSFSAVLAYALCWRLGRAAAVRFLGPRDLEEGENLFARYGGWLIVVSRWLPLFPETVSCMAGLTRMPFGRFLLAVVCGSAPIAFVFALIGKSGADRPVLAILLSALAPPALWAGVRLLILDRWRAQIRANQ